MVRVIVCVFAYEESVVIGQKNVFFDLSVEKSTYWELGQWVSFKGAILRAAQD